jgi:hypothetical protein
MTRPSIAVLHRNSPKGRARDRKSLRSPPVQGETRRIKRVIRVPFLLVPLDLRRSWRKPFGRASRVQICSRQICLWASKDKLARSEFGQPKAGPQGKTQGWVLQKELACGARPAFKMTGSASCHNSITLNQNLIRRYAPNHKNLPPHLSTSDITKSILPRIAMRSAIMRPRDIRGIIWRCGNEAVRTRVR